MTESGEVEFPDRLALEHFRRTLDEFVNRLSGNGSRSGIDYGGPTVSIDGLRCAALVKSGFATQATVEGVEQSPVDGIHGMSSYSPFAGAGGEGDKLPWRGAAGYEPRAALSSAAGSVHAKCRMAASQQTAAYRC